MAVGCTFSSDDIVIKSPTDKRLYRYIRLKNGLSALLIHDPDIYSDESIARAGADFEDEELDEDSGEEEEEDDSEDDDGESEDDEEHEGKHGASQTKKVMSTSSVYNTNLL